MWEYRTLVTDLSPTHGIAEIMTMYKVDGEWEVIGIIPHPHVIPSYVSSWTYVFKRRKV